VKRERVFKHEDSDKKRLRFRNPKQGIEVWPCIKIKEDAVGLAKETTLSSIDTKVATDSSLTSLLPRAKYGYDYIDGLWRAEDIRHIIKAELYDADLTVAQSVSLDCGLFGRSLIEVFCKSTAATDFTLEASPDNVEWATLWSKSLAAEGKYCDWDFCAMPYFRVRVPTTGIDIDTWIRAVQL